MSAKQIKLTFPDGSERTFPEGVTGYEVAESISKGLARNALSYTLDGEIYDLDRPIHHDGEIQINTWEDEDGKKTFWHSSAHLMAEAVETLYPGVKFGIGPPIDNGFYYDIDFGDHALEADELEKIEQKMHELARQKNQFKRSDISKEDALQYYKEKGDPYKIELIEELDDGEITFYQQGNFTDLCRGPHIPDTGAIKAIKLMSLAGAYWRGDEHNKQLTRIYGITFPKKKELDEYLEMLEEAKKRDHRKLGKEMELFSFSQRVGQGLPLWQPRGAILRDCLEDFLKKAQQEAGYEPVITPHIGSKELYVTSGHYEKYGEDSFQPINTPNENEEFLLKPMNCPHHCEIYNSRPRSYRELPIRYAEFGTVYRYEQSGELHGLTRVRGFTQDDAHIFCRADQVEDEFKKVIDLVLNIFEILDFSDYTAQISLRDKYDHSPYIGSDENWEKAEAAITRAAKDKGLTTKIEYGEAAFYGPKLDFMVKDALNRSWQLGTIQVDYNLPERFDLQYVGSDNERHRPVMIHRAPFGSMERFVSILIEHFAGDFPLWLAPEQMVVIPVSDAYNEYAGECVTKLRKEGFRCRADLRGEQIGAKIRDAENQKIPYMVIVGEKEMHAGSVSLRRHKKGDIGSFNFSEFITNIKEEVSGKLNPDTQLLTKHKE